MPNRKRDIAPVHTPPSKAHEEPEQDRWRRGGFEVRARPLGVEAAQARADEEDPQETSAA